MNLSELNNNKFEKHSETKRKIRKLECTDFYVCKKVYHFP